MKERLNRVVDRSVLQQEQTELPEVQETAKEEIQPKKPAKRAHGKLILIGIVVVLLLLCQGIGGSHVGMAELEAGAHEHAAGSPAHLPEPAHAGPEGEGKPGGSLPVHAQLFGKGDQDGLGAVVACLEVGHSLFSIFFWCFHNYF